jgi:hypothetical protein
MSLDTPSTASLPETPAAEPTPEAPVTPNPVPENIDALFQSTARFTRQGWNMILQFENDMQAVAYRRFQAVFQCETTAKASALNAALEAIDVPAIKQHETRLSAITTLAKIQEVIKTPGLKQVELTLLD